MFERSQVSKIALNAFVIVIFFVFVFVVVFLLVRSCFLITLIKCLKGHKCPGSTIDIDFKIKSGPLSCSQTLSGQLKTIALMPMVASKTLTIPSL